LINFVIYDLHALLPAVNSNCNKWPCRVVNRSVNCKR